MNVSLTPELESLVNRKIKAGMYQTASEVIREGLRLLQERDDRQARLRTDVRAGFAQIKRGEYLAYDEATTRNLAGEIKAAGRRRLAKLRKKTG